MFKHLLAFLTGDRVKDETFDPRANDGLERYVYSKEMLDEINFDRRYQILANRRQTEIYIVDTRYKQRVARLYDISYALVVADALNNNAGEAEE